MLYACSYDSTMTAIMTALTFLYEYVPCLAFSISRSDWSMEINDLLLGVVA
jgi:hypothetical protein